MKFLIQFAILFFIFTALVSEVGLTQTNSPTTESPTIGSQIDQFLSSKWYEKLRLRGYSQFRYNRLGETNKKLKCPQCDRSWGEDQGFFLRRGRLILFGEVSDTLYVYIQPDFASNSGTSQHYFQLRDAYFDLALESKKEFRLRFGQSKVPYSFENLQSSSNRPTLDRSDPINSSAPNERDFGLFFMYAPTEIRKRLSQLTSNNLKGSGDYGMFAIGAYNGQYANQPEKNNDLHRVVRLTYPFKLKSGQFVETSISAYEGKYFIDKSGDQSINDNFYEGRVAYSLIVYPQPIGFQFEFNHGSGPEFDPNSQEIRVQSLKGGYAMINTQIYHKDHRFFPYIRYQEYHGGKKHEGARAYGVKEYEIGSEWSPYPSFELTVAYAISDRLTNEFDQLNDRQKGQLIRLQAQFNY